MNKAELESKHIAELHDLAAEAGVERYRMLSRAELVEKLADGGGGSKPRGGERRGGGSGRSRQRDRNRKPRERREQRGPGERGPREQSGPREERAPREQRPAERAERKPEPAPAAAETPSSSARPKRRRRRRWGRRRKGVRIHDLLLPAAPGRQAIVYAESRADCTALLREVAAELSNASNGPDPIALLVDPTPEELADWKREAPRAEIVSAGKANHADDAIAQARARAEGGEDVVVLIDSLTRFAESFGGADEARDLFDAGRAAGSLTVVAAVERPA
jgi:hypothetical protein